MLVKPSIKVNKASYVVQGKFRAPKEFWDVSVAQCWNIFTQCVKLDSDTYNSVNKSYVFLILNTYRIQWNTDMYFIGYKHSYVTVLPSSTFWNILDTKEQNHDPEHLHLRPPPPDGYHSRWRTNRAAHTTVKSFCRLSTKATREQPSPGHSQIEKDLDKSVSSRNKSQESWCRHTLEHLVQN